MPRSTVLPLPYLNRCLLIFAKGLGCIKANNGNLVRILLSVSALAILVVQCGFAPVAQVQASPVVAPTLSVKVNPFGEVERLKQIIIKFDKEMATPGDITSEQARKFVLLVPELDGQWSFKDSQTLVLVPYEGAVKMATTYNVTVQSGIKALDGAKLDKEHLVQIITASARVYQIYPEVDQPLPVHPVFVAKYNQRVNTKLVSELVTVRSGLRTYPLRFLSEQQYLEGDTHPANVRAGASNWIAFETIDALPRNATVTVSFAPNCLSLDGPNINSKGRQYQYHTQGDLKLVQSPKGELPVYDDMTLDFEFDSVLDPSKFAKYLVQFDPPVGDYAYEIMGKKLVLKTNLKASTVYHVSFKPGLMDVNGETLGRAVSVDVHSSSRRPRFISFRNQIIIPKGSPPLVSFTAEGMPSAQLSIFKATAQDWNHFKSGGDAFIAFKKAQLLSQQTVTAGPDRSTINADLAPYLKDGLGQFVVVARASGDLNTNARCLAIWVQVTGLGIDVFSNDKLVAYVSDISSGEPVKDAKVSLYPNGPPGITDQYGLTQLPLTGASEVVEVTKGDDYALLLPFDLGKQIRPALRPLTYRFWCVTDKSTYLPGQTVYVKGLLRERQGKPGHSQYKLSKMKRIYYSLKSNSKELTKGELTLDEYGAFDFSYVLPENLPLDVLTITLATETTKLESSDNGFISYNKVYKTLDTQVDGSVYKFAFNVGRLSSPTVAAPLPERFIKIEAMQPSWSTDKVNNWHISVVNALGTPVLGVPVKVEIFRQAGLFAKQWLESKSLISAVKPIQMSYRPSEPGLYKIEASCGDTKQREVKYVRDVKAFRPGETSKSVVLPVLSIETSKAIAEPGETIKVKIKSPFYPAYGLILANAEDIEAVQPLVLKSGPSEFDLKLPVTNAPSVLLKAYVTGGGAQYLVEETKVLISTRARELQLVARPSSDKLQTGQTEVIDFTVKDSHGKAVKDAQIVAAIYQESADTVAPPDWNSLINDFYSSRSASLSTGISRHNLPPSLQKQIDPKTSALINAEQHGLSMPRYFELFKVEPTVSEPSIMMAHRYLGNMTKPNRSFAQFAVVQFSPAIVTDASGHASIKVPISDGNCRYRIRAVAIYGDDCFGMTEVNFGANKP